MRCIELHTVTWIEPSLPVFLPLHPPASMQRNLEDVWSANHTGSSKRDRHVQYAMG
jgi:hypothetical protein